MAATRSAETVEITGRASALPFFCAYLGLSINNLRSHSSHLPFGSCCRLSLKALLAALVLASVAAPSLARDGEVFFRKKGTAEVGPGTRIELVDCDGSHDTHNNSDGGLTCSIKFISDQENPYRVDQQ